MLATGLQVPDHESEPGPAPRIGLSVERGRCRENTHCGGELEEGAPRHSRTATDRLQHRCPSRFSA